MSAVKESSGLDRAGRGLRYGVLLAAAGIAATVGTTMRLGLGPALDPWVGAVMGLVYAALAGGLVTLLAAVFARLLTLNWTLVFAAAAIAIALLRIRFPLPAAVGAGLLIVVVEATLGASLAVILWGWRGTSASKRVVAVVGLVAALAANLAGLSWLRSAGDRDHLTVYEPLSKGGPPTRAPDPLAAGPHEVLTLHYGSGTDTRRAEFGAGADLLSPAVEVPGFLAGNDGWQRKMRARYWGFDLDRLPRNGRVWYPRGEGPFPLVLLVHGNHEMSVDSELGYAYLAEHLASRGYVAVAVDENFLNFWWPGDVRGDIDARAWLLLRHLEQWREWNRAEGHLFHGKIDLDRVGLIGHSRGGEAVYLAAVYNRLSRNPDDANVRFDFDFGIRAVATLAPTDGQHRPSGRFAPLENVDYLVLQGAHDAAEPIFRGARQFQRIGFTDDRYHFKASFYVYRANHGQWNTLWGRSDWPWPQGLLLNREPLLTGEEQRRFGRAVLTTFLEASLRRRPGYLGLLRDPGARWLPGEIVVRRFRDTTFRTLADYEEDLDVITGSAPGIEILGADLALWREDDLSFRLGRGTKTNQVAYVGFKAGAEGAPAPYYGLRLTSDLALELSGDARFVVALADTGREPPGVHSKTPRPLDLSVQLVAEDGRGVSLPLSRFGELLPPLPSRFTKLPAEAPLFGRAREPALATFELPVAAFVGEDPELDPARIREVRLVFDRSASGVLLVDAWGLSGPLPEPGGDEGDGGNGYDPESEDAGPTSAAG